MATVTSAEKISGLVGAIYDCVLMPENWRLVLEAINQEFHFIAAALGVTRLRPPAHILHVGAGTDPEWESRARFQGAEMTARWGGPERVAQFALDEPMVASRAIGPVRWRDNAYYRDMLEPRGIVDSVAIVIAREPYALGYVAFSRHRSAGEIGAKELDGLRLLGPHFRRAVTISNLFNMKAIEAATFASVLEGFAFGLVLVDAQLGIVHANAAAARMLAASDPIESRNGVLVLRERACNAALERAVQQAGLDESAMGPRGIGIPARRAEGQPCVIHVLPLTRGEMRNGLSQRATAALFIAPATVPPNMPSDALAVLFDLTPAETRIFELLVDGQTQSAIADRLGIARSTVKSHLLHLFEKCGCKRQVDLVRLAAGLTSPL